MNVILFRIEPIHETSTPIQLKPDVRNWYRDVSPDVAEVDANTR
jgi:hypothetical protein